jgi:hypothetical protein
MAHGQTLVGTVQAASTPAGPASANAPGRADLVRAAKAALALAFNMGGTTEVQPIPRAEASSVQGRTSAIAAADNGFVDLGGGVRLHIPPWYDELAAVGSVPR